MSEEGAAVEAGEAAPAGAAAVLGSEATAAGGTSETPAEAAWHDGKGLSPDTVQLFEAKGWHKSENPFEEASKGYRNLERLRGVPGEKLLRLPDEGNEEQAAEFRERLGIPESAEGYAMPEAAVNGEPIDTGVLAQIAHALEVTPANAEKLPGLVSALLESSMAEQTAATEASLGAQAATWESGQGEALEENMVHAERGFAELGWDADFANKVKLIGDDGLARVMNAAVMVGRLTAESRPGKDGENSGGSPMPYGLTKDAAKTRLAERGDELSRRAREGDKAAAKEYDELKRVAFY